ncbi:hypothetical protein [Streptomyces sp. NPDC048636]|uniref:hypothetical protein n=1 Tax=Streptomyces sp. NPDC048636 TaxID=3155762 RepID=UPI0034137C81
MAADVVGSDRGPKRLSAPLMAPPPGARPPLGLPSVRIDEPSSRAPSPVSVSA